MNATPQPVELLLVDYRPQEDLMFWDQFSRSLAGVNREGRWIGVVVGCAEQVQNALIQHGFPSSRTNDDELTIPIEAHSIIEKVVRDEMRTISTRFTDEGISAVGMIGFERGLVRCDGETIEVAKNIRERLWQAPGVVPVLMSLCKDKNGALRDIHPVMLAHAWAQLVVDQPVVSILSHRLESAQNLGTSTHEKQILDDLVRAGTVTNLIQKVTNRLNWTITGPFLPNK